MFDDRAAVRLFCRRLTLISYFGLIASLLFGALVNGPHGVAAKLALWLITISGLLLVMKGLLQDRKRSYQWLGFILLIYFVAAVQSIFAMPSDASPLIYWNAIIRMFCIVAGFTGAILAVRLAR